MDTHNLNVIRVRAVISNQTKNNKTLMLKLYFYTRFVIIPTCFDLSWSSSGCDLYTCGVKRM